MISRGFLRAWQHRPTLRYVGNGKNDFARKFNEGRNIPAMKRGAKRFLPASSGNLNAGQNGQIAPLMIGKPVSGSMS